MGEQPKPVEDEVERALASMRAGFLSGSEQIAAHIASLDEHLVDAPSEEREAVRAQVARLVASPRPHHRQGSERASVVVGQLQGDGERGQAAADRARPGQPPGAGSTCCRGSSRACPDHARSLPPCLHPRRSRRRQPPDELLLPRHSRFAADDGLRARHAGFRAGDALPPRRRRLPRRAPASASGAGCAGRHGLSPRRRVPPEALAVPRNRPAARRQPRAAGRRPAAGPRPELSRPVRRPACVRAARASTADPDGPEGRGRLLAVARERTAGFRGLAAMVVVGDHPQPCCRARGCRRPGPGCSSSSRPAGR